MAAEGGLLLRPSNCLTKPSAVCSSVYREGFYVALSNLPGNIFTILLMDSTGGKILLCESGGCTNDLAPVMVLGCSLKLPGTCWVRTLTAVLRCICSLQPGGVRPEHLPHLCGADPRSEPGPVLRF